MSGNDPLMIEDGGGSVAAEIFALTDEQILGMEVEGQEVEADPSSRESANSSQGPSTAAATAAASARDDKEERRRRSSQSTSSREELSVQDGKNAQPGMAVPQEPPAWLAREMSDPWVGEEARELWEGVQRAQREAAAYREAIATPEDARALKEIYPGGVAEAKSAAVRARELAEIDAVFFGAAGKPAEELRAGRVQLVEKLYSQDPTAFREMVEAGVRILGNVGGRSSDGERVSQAATTLPGSLHSESQTARLSGRDDRQTGVTGGDGQTDREAQAGVAVPQEVASRYREFERATNAELEKSVGGTIARAMEAALPNLRQVGREGPFGQTQGKQAPPLQERLRVAVREEVETALRSDASLGEQVARILSGRRLDEAARAQVVRLIDARAQQLVPGAVRRVVGAWTQATLGARKTDAVSTSGGRGAEERRVERASSSSRTASGEQTADRNQKAAAGSAGRAAQRGRVDYRKLSDEQILGM